MVSETSSKPRRKPVPSSGPKRVLGVEDIPGAILPAEAAARDTAAQKPAGPTVQTDDDGSRRARLIALLGQRAGQNGTGDAAGQRGGAGVLRALLQARGNGKAGANASGRQILAQLTSRINESGMGDENKRKAFVRALQRVMDDYDALEREIAQLKTKLADAEAQIQALTEGDELAGGR